MRQACRSRARTRFVVLKRKAPQLDTSCGAFRLGGRGEEPADGTGPSWDGLEVLLERLAVGAVAEAADAFLLDLTDALAGQTELQADLLQRHLAAAVQAEG